MINETFASKRLAQLAKEHGGIKVGRNGGLRDGTYAYYGGNGIDLSKVTDDMLYGEPFEYSWDTASNEQRNNSIHFNDGYAIALKPYNLAKNDNIDVPGRKQKPSRYFTGIGDTGDHDKKESPFFKDGKRDVGPQYNGFGVSSRAGESQNYREAFKNNKEDYEYFKLHPERSDAKDGMRRAASNMSTIRGYGKQLLNKNENKDMDKNVVKLNESQLKKIVAESVKRILKEDFSVDYVREKCMADAEADARADGEAQMVWEYLQSCKQLFNDLKSNFQNSMKIINKIDPTEFWVYSDDMEGFLSDMYNFLEENEMKIDRLSSGEFLLNGNFNL